MDIKAARERIKRVRPYTTLRHDLNYERIAFLAIALDDLPAALDRIEELEGDKVRLFRKLRRIEAERDNWQRLCNEAEKRLIDQGLDHSEASEEGE